MTVFIINELKRDTYVHFTEGSKQDEEYLRSIVGPRVHIKLVKIGDKWWWKLSAKHYDALVGMIAWEKSLFAAKQYANQKFCTTQCQEGKPENWDKCTCVCEGYHHGEAPSGFVPVNGSLLVETKRFYVGSQYFEGKWIDEQVVVHPAEFDLMPQLVGGQNV